MKKSVVISIFLIFLFFVTRLINLGIIPIFTDEAIYVRWSQIMANDAGLRYLPLIDGKQPLYMWMVMLAMKILPNFDPLITGRLVSVGSGLLAVVGVFFAANQIFNNKNIGFLSALLYILVPFTLFYDRFALADSMLAMWGIWSIGLSVLMAKSLRLDVALILGAVVGFGLLTKTPGMFFLLFMPLSLLFLKSWKKIFLWLGLFALVIIISQVFYALLRLFPLFNMIAQKNAEFAVSFIEFLHSPLQFFVGNFLSMIQWEGIYLTWPLAIVLIVSLLRRSKKTYFLLAYFVAFLLIMAIFNKRIYPRYLLLFTPGLLIVVADEILRWKKFAITIVLILIPAIYTDFKLLTDPVNAPIPYADSYQYLNGWSAGFGVREVRQFLSQHPNSTIVTEGTFGLMPYSLDLYQKEYPTVIIKSYWPLPDVIPADLIKRDPVYVLVYQHLEDPVGWKPKLIMSYKQGRGTDSLRLYYAQKN